MFAKLPASSPCCVISFDTNDRVLFASAISARASHQNTVADRKGRRSLPKHSRSVSRTASSAVVCLYASEKLIDERLARGKGRGGTEALTSGDEFVLWGEGAALKQTAAAAIGGSVAAAPTTLVHYLCLL